MGVQRQVKIVSEIEMLLSPGSPALSSGRTDCLTMADRQGPPTPPDSECPPHPYPTHLGPPTCRLPGVLSLRVWAGPGTAEPRPPLPHPSRPDARSRGPSPLPPATGPAPGPRFRPSAPCTPRGAAAGKRSRRRGRGTPLCRPRLSPRGCASTPSRLARGPSPSFAEAGPE